VLPVKDIEYEKIPDNEVTISQKKTRASGSLSGVAGVHFVVGELSRLGFIALPTVKNTKDVDIIASTQDFTKTIYVQVKANKIKYDFWIVGKALNKDDLFYVFVNLLSNQPNARPEYYVVPSKDVSQDFQRFEKAMQNVTPTEAEVAEVIKRINNRETAWGIVWTAGVCIQKIREIANNNDLKIKSDRNKGVDFPFCFFIRKDKQKYENNWDLLFAADLNSLDEKREYE
jgi:hypothetical protein